MFAGFATTLLLLLNLSGLNNIAPENLRQALILKAMPKNTADISTVHPVVTQKPIKTGPAEINVAAHSALIVDVDTMRELYSKNPDSKAPVASLTKLMGILVILRDFQLDAVVTVPILPIYQSGEALAGIKSGQNWTVESLVLASLIPSGNDAIDALAIIDSGGITPFAAKMNRLSREWGIDDARFVSANGLSDQNTATARGIAKIAKLALTNQRVKVAVAKSTAEIQGTSQEKLSLISTNQLLSDPRVSGIKTGYTLAAGECLVTLAKVNNHEIITVVMGSTDRFGDTTNLLNWVEKNHQWL